MPNNIAYGYSHPLDGAYWTGSTYGAATHAAYQQPYYGSPYGHNPFGMSGYGIHNYNTYPAFNPSFWGGQYPANVYPYRHNVLPGPVHPVYPGHVMHHPGYVPHYNGGVPRHLMPRKFGQGLLSGTSTKGILGAVLVGTVAGLVARGK